MSSPRPILKSSRKSSTDAGSPPRSPSSVHFTECLTTTYLTHGSVDYNRSPIDVTPNECAMPRRGCPDRTYSEPASTQWALEMDVSGPHYIDDSEESDSSNSSDSSYSRSTKRAAFSKPSGYSYSSTYSMQRSSQPSTRTYNFESGRDDHWNGCLGGF